MVHQAVLASGYFGRYICLYMMFKVYSKLSYLTDNNKLTNSVPATSSSAAVTTKITQTAYEEYIYIRLKRNPNRSLLRAVLRTHARASRMRNQRFGGFVI